MAGLPIITVNGDDPGSANETRQVATIPALADLVAIDVDFIAFGYFVCMGLLLISLRQANVAAKQH